MTRDAIGLAALTLAALVGCGGPGAHTRAAGAVAPLAVRVVPWNYGGAPLGRVRAVTDAGDFALVCSDAGATVLSSLAVVATDASLRGCRGAATIAGADGAPRWLVVIDAAGHLHRLRASSVFEEVSQRYGLGHEGVRGASPLGGGQVGFRLDTGVAIADGSAVARYPLGPFSDFAGGAGLGVGVANDGLHVVDGARHTTTFFPLPGATHAAVDPAGRLYATTARAVYAANDRGELALLYEADGDTLHGLVASGTTVWFADGAELGVVDGARVA